MQTPDQTAHRRRWLRVKRWIESLPRTIHRHVLDLLLIMIFGCHLLAVDLAMAGPLVAIWLEWRATRHGDELAGQIGRRLAVWSLATATVGVGLGLLAVAALPHFEPVAYREMFGRVPSSGWWWAAAEIVVYLVCMAAYVLLWRRWTGHRIWHRVLAVFAATNLMYHFPPLFTIISVLSLRPDLKVETLDRATFRKMLLDGEVLSRVIHHWLAGVAVAAGMAMVLAIRAAGALGRPAVEDGAGSGSPAPNCGRLETNFDRSTNGADCSDGDDVANTGRSVGTARAADRDAEPIAR